MKKLKRNFNNRKQCSFPGCTNLGKRVGHREYSDRCFEHPRMYTAQEVS